MMENFILMHDFFDFRLKPRRYSAHGKSRDIQTPMRVMRLNCRVFFLWLKNSTDLPPFL